jgi:hypothetical protein
MPEPAAMPRWVEMATAILLSVAGLTTAWASYQASLWGGEQMSHYSVASGKLTTASQMDIVAGQTAAIDTSLFIAWVDAAINGEVDRAHFLQERFSKPFTNAFIPWRASFPEDMKGYRLPPGAKTPTIPSVVYPQAGEAAQLRESAARIFAEGEAANGISDRFVAITVLLSTVLFLGGISQLLQRPAPRIAMLVLASLLCLGSVVWLFTLPSSGL